MVRAEVPSGYDLRYGALLTLSVVAGSNTGKHDKQEHYHNQTWDRIDYIAAPAR